MARDEKARERIDRRTYLKLAGVGALSAAATGVGSRTAAAANAGYGKGGYGSTTYGGTTSSESALSVSATGATSVTQTEALLDGSVTDLGGASSANVHFEYRRVGASSWKATSGQSISSTGTFSKGVSGLQAGADYEYRVAVSASDGDTAASSAATFTTKRHALVIDGSSQPDTSNAYSFSVNGSVEKSSSLGSINSYDTVSGSSVSGQVVGGKDGYRFTGDVTDFQVDGSPSVYLDGQQINPADLGDTTYPNTLVLDGSAATRQTATYEATVSGKLKKSSSFGSINSYDTISGSTASGQVVGGKDGYRFTGELNKLVVDGKLTISLQDGNGSSTATDSLPNTFVVDGTGSPNRAATYSITVSGNVEKSANLGSINGYDTVSGSTASGRVLGGKDGYRYSGDVTKIEIDGPAVLRFEDTDG